MAREPAEIAGQRRALGERLAAFRQAAGMTQGELARMVFRHRTTLAHVEKGRRPADEQFWVAVDAAVDANGMLVTGFRDIEAKRRDHENRIRAAALAKARSRATAEADDDLLGLAYLSDNRATVAVVGSLGRNDVHRRDFLRSAAFVVAASVAPSRDWLVATLDAQPRPGRRVGHEQVTAVRRAFAMFQEVDVMQGGGHARQALARYVTEQVLPMLRDVDSASDAGSALFAAASEQTYLLGWMAFDDGRHALAQRYLIQSLALARASGDVPLGAHVLAGMSDQVRMLGHPQEALQLAATGRHGLGKHGSPACLADLWALQARAHSAVGEGKEAALAVAQSEAAFDKVRRENEPEWARFIDVAYLAGEWANAFGEVNRPEESIEFAQRSVDEADRQGRARRGALSQAALARAALSEPCDLEAAVDNAHRTLSLAVRVKSSRCVAAVEDLRRRFGPYETVPEVRDFNERAQILLPSAV